MSWKLKKTMTLFKPGDALVYGMVIAILAAGFINMSVLVNNASDRLAIVEINGKVLHTIHIEQNMKAKEIHLDAGEGRYNVVYVEYDFIEVLNSNCPDQVCVGWGKIRYSGQTIVCLPFRIVIRITGQAEEGLVDDVTW